MTTADLRRPLEGKAGIVTGAASGIGRATVQALVKVGARVVVADIDEAGCRETIEIVGGEDHAVFVRCDITDAASAQAMVDFGVATYGRIDFAHNNAGTQGAGHELADITDSEWARTVAVNLTGAWHCMRAEIPHMLAAGGGSIINTAGALGIIAIPRQAGYIAAKHGVVGLTRAAALEYSSRGVRVNAVCPGVIETPLFQAAADADPALRPFVEAAHPIGRLGRPSEIADAVVWLAGDSASFVTGTALSVDGGYITQ